MLNIFFLENGAFDAPQCWWIGIERGEDQSGIDKSNVFLAPKSHTSAVRHHSEGFVVHDREQNMFRVVVTPVTPASDTCSSDTSAGPLGDNPAAVTAVSAAAADANWWRGRRTEG